MSDSGAGKVAAAPDAQAAARRDFSTALSLAMIALVVFYFSTNGKMRDFDYTYRIAASFLEGRLGLQEAPPSWLNEAIPYGGKYYSVFPLGAVLAVLPLALLQKAKLIDKFPGRGVSAVLVASSIYFFFQLTALGDVSWAKRICLALFPIFGTWSWANLGFGGAWQIALAFALLGQVASLYFTLVKPRPWLAGACFALAFGNRTELILLAPIYLYFWLRQPPLWGARALERVWNALRQNWKTLARFAAIPVALGLCTAGYNLARFHSIFDFGYTRIPGLLDEPWYRHGLFSLQAIPWNAYKMLFEGLQDIPKFPYLRPYGFGASIFLVSPFLFLLFREGGKYRTACWSAIGVLTFVLWCHGNPGGWQFSYRYAIVLLPWMFLLLLGNGPRTLSAREAILLSCSIALNALGAYQFLWTDQIKP